MGPFGSPRGELHGHGQPGHGPGPRGVPPWGMPPPVPAPAFGVGLNANVNASGLVGGVGLGGAPPRAPPIGSALWTGPGGTAPDPHWHPAAHGHGPGHGHGHVNGPGHAHGHFFGSPFVVNNSPASPHNGS